MEEVVGIVPRSGDCIILEHLVDYQCRQYKNEVEEPAVSHFCEEMINQTKICHN